MGKGLAWKSRQGRKDHEREIGPSLVCDFFSFLSLVVLSLSPESQAPQLDHRKKGLWRG